LAEILGPKSEFWDFLKQASCALFELKNLNEHGKLGNNLF